MTIFKFNSNSKITASLFIILFFLGFESFSNSIKQDSTIKINKNFIGFLPSKSNCINGIAIGVVGSEVFCDYKISKISNGLNLQVGQGLILSPLILYDMKYLYKKNKYQIDSLLLSTDTSYFKAKHNGLICSLFGSATDKINGISISGFFSVHKIINGLSISTIGINYYKINGVSIAIINKGILTKGVQFGVYNSSVELKGIQFGLWNKNKKRSFPIINW
jgi:hypothetical protein